MEEPLAPQAHHIAADRERGGDLVVGTTLGGKQNHLGTEEYLGTDHYSLEQRGKNVVCPWGFMGFSFN